MGLEELRCYWRIKGENRQKKRLAVNFPKLTEDIKPQIQEARGEKKDWINNYRQILFFKYFEVFWKPNKKENKYP